MVEGCRVIEAYLNAVQPRRRLFVDLHLVAVIAQQLPNLPALGRLAFGPAIHAQQLVSIYVDQPHQNVEILFDATRIRLQSSDIEQLVADITKAGELLKWQPEVSLDMGLKRTIEWFSEHV